MHIIEECVDVFGVVKTNAPALLMTAFWCRVFRSGVKLVLPGVGRDCVQIGESGDRV